VNESTDEYDVEIDPTPEPDAEPADPHQGPLDDDDDARFLRREDPRRKRIEEEHRLGHRIRSWLKGDD
jgi:hypothetical protein